MTESRNNINKFNLYVKNKESVLAQYSKRLQNSIFNLLEGYKSVQDKEFSRARPDIATTIAFLCTRPVMVDVDDWRKLKRLLQYLRTTIDLELIIGADALEAFKTYIGVA